MSLIEINISNRIWIGAKYLEHPLVYYSVIMALTCVGKAGESYQTDIDKCGKDMWNFFQADRFFFWTIYKAVLQEMTMFPALRENDCIRPKTGF